MSTKNPNPTRPPAAHIAHRRLGAWLALWLMACSCQSTAPLPRGIVTDTRRITLTGREVAVDFFRPRGGERAPVVVVAHGFSRNRLTMAGWGRLLASNGFIAVVPDLPAWADHERNARALSELLDRILAGEFSQAPRPADASAFMGFSAGGLSSLLAAATNRHARCWVGLDPVDLRGLGAGAAKGLRIPCLVAQTEPGSWNAQGNARPIADRLAGPCLRLRVKGACHVDAEDPTDWLAELACGKSDPRRREVIQRYAVAALRSVFFADRAAMRTLQAAVDDPALKDVTARRLEGFPGAGKPQPFP